MAGALDQPLDIDLGAAEGALGLRGRVAEGRFEIALAIHAAHAFPAAAGHGLQQDGVSVCRGECTQGVEADGVIGAGDDRSARGDGGAPRGRLGAHRAD